MENREENRVVLREIEDEMKSSFIDYAMSVIVSRAIPDVRDGLKPVHRRILFSMNESGMHHNKAHKKCARIVGDTLGRYHPHGDMAVYDSLVRMAQPFSLRYPLIDGQGNFGSIDGDSQAAMRYCVTGDTLVSTDRGIIPIKEISKKKEEQIKLKVLNYDGKILPATKFFNSGKHNTIFVETASGYSLEGSLNHPILTWALSDEYRPILIWKTLNEINVSDIVVLNRRGMFSCFEPDLTIYCPNEGFKNDVKLPKKMTKDLGFFLGALVSEGSFHNKQILFCNSNKKYYDYVKSIAQKYFTGVKLYESRLKGNCFQFAIYEQKVVKFLENIGLTNARSEGKVVPHIVLSSTKETIAMFLNGLFEGDGSVLFMKDKRHGGQSIQLNYNSKSKSLLDQLRIILLNFGIICSKDYIDKRNGCGKLIISGINNITKFHAEIGFFSEEKKSNLKRVKLLNKTRLSKSDFIPFISEYIRNKYADIKLYEFNFDRYNSLLKNYNKLCSLIDSGDKIMIDFLIKNHYYFSQITKKVYSKTQKVVYSVRVKSDCHSFTANGFINHNTEARLNKIAEELLFDIDKETIHFTPNFDGSLKEPVVLPAKIPNLLLNGSSGIAVGMATNIPPHNMAEVCDAVVAQINNKDISVSELMSLVRGPDFPTGGEIVGRSGILSMYSLGRGKMIVQAKTKFETISGREYIIVYEIPYMVNKATLVEEIANQVKEKKIIGISELRDESDREGMRIVIGLKKDANKEVVLNQLYQHTAMKTTFGAIMLALDAGIPKVFTLKEIIQSYIDFRFDVVTKRCIFDLKEASNKAHILSGLIIALDHIDEVIRKIKASSDASQAQGMLMADYSLTEVQAKAILDMKLQKLASLEQDKIRFEFDDLEKLIKKLNEILGSESMRFDIIKNELSEIKTKYSDLRRTTIIDAECEDVTDEDLIKEEDMVVLVSNEGYVKRVPLETYRQQKRGGKGVNTATNKETDFISKLFVASTHSYLLFFTNSGNIYWLKVYQIPEASRIAKGKPVINLINIPPEERITAVIPVREFDDISYLIMATKKGVVKKTKLEEYSRPRSSGIIAITLDEGDELINVERTTGNDKIVLATKDGNAIKFEETDVRSAGRSARGVRGITLDGDDIVIGMVVADETKKLLTVTEDGYGKKTEVSEYRLTNRGGKGVINLKVTDKTGKVVSILSLSDEDEVLFVSRNGSIIRVLSSDISTIGRATQGVRIMRLDPGDKAVSSSKIISE